MGGILSSLGLGDLGDNKFGWIATIFGSLLGPIGHLVLRVLYLNGSLDKPWLFLPGSIPPFSIGANILMKWGFVQNGPGAPVYDYWMLIPIIAKFICSFISSMGGDNIGLTIALLIVQLIATMVPNYIRMSANCQGKVDWEGFKKIFVDSYGTFGLAQMLPMILPRLPMIGMMIGFLNHIPGFRDMLWSLGFATAYILTNMINQNKIAQYCTNPNDPAFSSWVVLAISSGLIYFSMPKRRKVKHIAPIEEVEEEQVMEEQETQKENPLPNVIKSK